MAEEPADQQVDDAPSGGGGWFTGYKLWVFVIGVTLAQTAFWIFMMYIREPGSAPEQTNQNKTLLMSTELLHSRVELSNFSATVSGPGGDLRPLNFNLVMELQYLPEEMRPGAAVPTLAQIEVFRTVVVQLESKIRDHLNTFLANQSFTNLTGGRGQDLVKAEVMRFVNSELEKYDFAALKIPDNISRRRVTNVLLPSWTLM